MHGEGKWSLIRLFTSLAMVGAEWVMWILVALSIVSIGIMLERMRFYLTLSDNLDALAEELRDLLRRKDIAGARRRLEKSPSPAATIALAGLAEIDNGASAADEAMQGATARTRLGLERNLAFLGTVGNNAPFIGLLGTVIGIIQAFDALKTNQTGAATGATANAVAAAQQTLGATGRVMGTIAEALVATAIGLFVAIPAVAAFNYFQRKVRSIVSSSDTLSHVVLAYLRATPTAEAVATPAPTPAKTEKPAGKGSNEKKSDVKDAKDKTEDAASRSEE